VVHLRRSERRTEALVEDLDAVWNRIIEACSVTRPLPDCERLTGAFLAQHGSRINVLVTSSLVDPREVRRWVYTDTSVAGWQELTSYVGKMARLCQRSEVPLLLAVVPDGAQVDPAQVLLRRSLGVELPDSVLTEEGPFQNLVRELARRMGAPCFDPLERFRSVREGLYFETDGHFTAAGHRLYGQELARTLIDGGYLERARSSRASSSSRSVARLPS
jgi:hypothetical protein